MSDQITASFDTLHQHAKDSAESYLTRAIRNIDEEFGKGYAQENPLLVAAFMQAASREFTMGAMTKVFGSGLEEIAESIRNLRD